MKPYIRVLLVLIIWSSSIVAKPASPKSDSTPSAPAPSKSRPKGCEAPSLIYCPVDASYVGGTIPDIDMKIWRSVPLGMMRLAAYQFRLNGRFAMGLSNVVFAFKSGHEIEGTSQLHIFHCTDEGKLEAEAKELCQQDHRIKYKSEWYVIEIPYRRINVLARARKLATDQATDRGAYITVAGAFLALLESFPSTTHAKLQYGAAAAAAALVGYYFFVSRPNQQENYISIFTGEKATECEGMEERPPNISGESYDKCSKAIYLPGDVTIFRIPNPHDYYNVSLTLNGKTGLQFVAQGAEKGGGK